MIKMLPVKTGIDTLPKPMTKKQALAYGVKMMPRDLELAGFICSIFESDQEIHGGRWYRINYGKSIPASFL